MAFKAGDWVKWTTSSGKAAVGKVVSVHTASTVPNQTTKISGSEDDPVCRIQVWKRQDNGDLVSTTDHVAVKVADLKGTDKPKAATSRGAAGVEHRHAHSVEVRQVGQGGEGFVDGKPRFWARVLNYNVLDDFNTTFAPGCFLQSLQQRMPRLLYGHSGWSNMQNVIGRGVDYRDTAEGLDVLFEMDDFDAVPGSRQVWAQLGSGTLDEFSVGFERRADEPDPVYFDETGAVRITRGRLFEVSSVIEGAVPDTGLLSMSRSATRDAAAVAFMAYLEGRMSFEEAMGRMEGIAEGRSPETLVDAVAQIDASCDSLCAYLAGEAPDLLQVTALAGGLQTLIDNLMDAMGIPDPDDDDAMGGRARPDAEREQREAALDAEAREVLAGGWTDL